MPLAGQPAISIETAHRRSVFADCRRNPCGASFVSLTPPLESSAISVPASFSASAGACDRWPLRSPPTLPAPPCRGRRVFARPSCLTRSLLLPVARSQVRSTKLTAQCRARPESLFPRSCRRPFVIDFKASVPKCVPDCSFTLVFTVSKHAPRACFCPLSAPRRRGLFLWDMPYF